jgi:hypothetical protein
MTRYMKRQRRGRKLWSVRHAETNGQVRSAVTTLDPDPMSSRFFITVQVARGGWQ